MRKLKGLIAALIILSVFFPNPGAAVGELPSLEAKAAILIEAETGAILYASGENEKMYPASTTKILTALVAVENGDLEANITVGSEILLVPKGSSLAHLSKGDTLTLADLLYGLLLPSGNDAAYTIAVYLARLQTGEANLSPKEALSAFAEIMNNRAMELGAKKSHFTCPDGFHDDNHYTTAQDLALIAQEALTHAFIRKVISTTEYNIQFIGSSKTRLWRNSNALINPLDDNYYPNATGLKTGYTSMAGSCLLGSANNGNLALIAVCLDSPKDARWSDAKALFDYGFGNYTWQKIINEGDEVLTLSLTNNDWDQPDHLTLICPQGFRALFSKDELATIQEELIIDSQLLNPVADQRVETHSNSFSLRGPIPKGQVLGRIVYTIGDKEIFASDLVAEGTTAPRPWWREGPLTIAISATANLLFLSIILYKLFIRKTYPKKYQ